MTKQQAKIYLQAVMHGLNMSFYKTLNYAAGGYALGAIVGAMFAPFKNDAPDAVWCTTESIVGGVIGAAAVGAPVGIYNFFAATINSIKTQNITPATFRMNNLG